MKIISLGAGVQSTTLYLMSCRGVLERADCAIFADTQWEPRWVYEHLELLRNESIPIAMVSIGNIRDAALSSTRFASMPVVTKNEDGVIARLRRQCTREYKVEPIQRKCRDLGATAKNPIEIWIGISVDEVHRMKDSRVQYTQHRWPLIEQRMDRQQCKTWLAQNWPHGVRKSSCIGCPYHDDQYWQDLKDSSPAEFDDAVQFDKKIRHLPRVRDETFLHRSAQPLGEIEFTNRAQLDLFSEECEGYCGL